MMAVPTTKFFKRKKNVSRNERAEKFSRHFRLKGEAQKGLLPRLGLLAIFVVAAVLLFPPSRRTHDVLFKAGQIADRNIIAPFDFEVPLSDDALKLERAGASLQVLPVYVHDSSVERDLTHDLATVFDSLRTIIKMDSLSADKKMDKAGALLPYLSRNMLREVIDLGRLSKIEQAAKSYQKELFERGFVDNAGPLRRRSYTDISVLSGPGGTERFMPVKDLVDQGKVEQVIKEEAFSRFQKNRTSAQVFYEIVRAHLLPNLMLDVKETEDRRATAAAAVPKTIKVSKNERVIGKHDKVTPEQEKMLAALEKTRMGMETQKTPWVIVSLYAAEVLRLLILGLFLGAFLYAFHRRTYTDFLKMTAILTVLLIFLAFSTVVFRMSLSSYLVPVVFVSLMIAALFDYRLGLVAAVFAAFLITLVTNVAPHVAFVSVLAGTVGVLGLLHMRSRSHFYSVFGLVVLAYVVGVISTELGQLEKFSDLYQQVLWSVGSGLFSTLAAMFLLPIFEAVFSLTTRFTMLELTDLNKPILKRLNMAAPGTYHHSMMLGSLVDSVASEIDADALKARVMAYYHDIGKTFKPEYYAENQEAGFNKHEKITPQMSALILLSHVKDGVELAREEKLPELIVDAIQQHHGTTVMAYFYQKALETDSHSSVNKDDFRYPGPRPRSKEAALLMLADTVEPACRSLKDPTPTHIRNMVVKLISARAQEGELDESGLTLNDLATIREKFVPILSGIYHKRVAYPGQEPQEEKKQGEAVAKSV